jgi:thioredoxin reductase
MWVEGRQKLEPWLADRISKDSIYLHPHEHVTECRELPSGELKISLANNQIILIDHIILATGYKMDILRVPMLTNGNLANELHVQNGYPVLDETFQSNIPNLYFTGFPAAQDFGPFFGFTAAVRASSKVIGRAVAKG